MSTMDDLGSSHTPVPGEETYSTPTSVSSNSQEFANSPMQCDSPTLMVSQKGIEQAKKRLRAFSIQKKMPVTPKPLPPKPTGGVTTVVIGKLSGIKPVQKPPPDPEAELKRMPKPPKPGCFRKSFQETYSQLQQRTLGEIEDMKKKMELAELGIPLGLIGPDASNDQAMPTGAMPPIKSFLTPAQLVKVVKEAKKARAEGKQFKFNYKKLLPDYDNPFQNKKLQRQKNDKEKNDDKREERDVDKEPDKEMREYRELSKWERNEPERNRSDRRRNDRSNSKYRSRHDRDRYRDKSSIDKKDKVSKEETEEDTSERNDAEVNLQDYLVCDSWSLETEEKATTVKTEQELTNTDKKLTESSPIIKKEIVKLQPVSDTFSYEIDDDPELDIFDDSTELKSFAKPTVKKIESKPVLYDPFDNASQSSSLEDQKGNEDSFLESIINEIKEENISDDDINQSFLVEYDTSPDKKVASGSATPEVKKSPTRSYSAEGRKSVESCKSIESGYRSTDSLYKVDKKSKKQFSIDNVDQEISKATMDSLETWTFVLKICQPLLFRHDRNKCYRETTVVPKLWFTENPKVCSCVQDRSIVYEELDSCKMALVDRVYGCDQIPDSPHLSQRGWYPVVDRCLIDTPFVQHSSTWEDDSSQASETNRSTVKEIRSPITVQKKENSKEDEEMTLDKAYQRFMDAVMTSEANKSAETSRGNTPTKVEMIKPEVCKKRESDSKRKSKKEKESQHEDWSQESEVDSEKSVRKTKTKSRKRKQSSSSSDDSSSDTDESVAKKKKSTKDKSIKRNKSKVKKRKIEEKKRKAKKKRNAKKKTKYSTDETEKEKSKKKKKKIKFKKSLKKNKRKRKQSSSSSSTSSESEEESKEKIVKKPAKKSKIKTDFDVNILKNIKTERLTDDEKGHFNDYIPRRQFMPQKEIINVKELQSNLVAIKQEATEDKSKIKIREPNENKAIENIEPNDKAVENIATTIKKDVESIENKAIGNIEPVVKKAVENVEPVVKKAIENVEPVVKKAVENVEPVVKKAVENVEPVVKKAVENVKPIGKIDNITKSTEIELEKIKPKAPSPVPFPDISIISKISSIPKISTTIGTVAKDFDKVLESSSFDQMNDHNEVDKYDADEYEYRQNCDGFDGSYDFTKNDEKDSTVNRIEVVKISDERGEIKCDWRAGVNERRHSTSRPSRWGLKPGDANIILTGNTDPDEVYPIRSVLDNSRGDKNTYKIETISTTRGGNDANDTGYDEAYADMYGASDKLQYGDCFSEPAQREVTRLSLDDRIDKVLRDTAPEIPPDEVSENNKNLINKEVPLIRTRSNKRVSFADGYKPGQDSDTEKPPKKKIRPARSGCAWPCPAEHPDHVPLWDALPPPPPPAAPPPHTQQAQTYTL